VAFDQLGYRYFNLVDQIWCPCRPVLSRRAKSATAKIASRSAAAAFLGARLPGRRVDKLQTLELYEAIFVRYALNGNNGLFGRWTSIFHMAGQFQKILDRIR